MMYRFRTLQEIGSHMFQYANIRGGVTTEKIIKRNSIDKKLFMEVLLPILGKSFTVDEEDSRGIMYGSWRDEDVFGNSDGYSMYDITEEQANELGLNQDHIRNNYDNCSFPDWFISSNDGIFIPGSQYHIDLISRSNRELNNKKFIFKNKLFEFSEALAIDQDYVVKTKCGCVFGLSSDFLDDRIKVISNKDFNKINKQK